MYTLHIFVNLLNQLVMGLSSDLLQGPTFNHLYEL